MKITKTLIWVRKTEKNGNILCEIVNTNYDKDGNIVNEYIASSFMKTLKSNK